MSIMIFSVRRLQTKFGMYIIKTKHYIVRFLILNFVKYSQTSSFIAHQRHRSWHPSPYNYGCKFFSLHSSCIVGASQKPNRYPVKDR